MGKVETDRDKLFKKLKDQGVIFGTIGKELYKVSYDIIDGLIMFKLQGPEWELETSYNWGVLIKQFDSMFDTEEELLNNKV